VKVQQLIARSMATTDRLRQKATQHVMSARTAVQRCKQSVLVAACSGDLSKEWRTEHKTAAVDDQVLSTARDRRQDQQGRRYREPEPNRYAVDVDLPDGWSNAPLGLLLESIKYGTSKRSDYGAAGVPVLRIPNVSAGYLDLSDLKFAPLDPREVRDLALKSSDLLLIRSNGSPRLVGRAVMVGPEAEGMAYAGYMMRLTADQELCNPFYLALALAAPQVRRQVEMPLRSTSGINNINTDEVRALMIPLPPVEEQVEIVRRADTILAYADPIISRVDRASHAVDRTAQSVLEKAFRGDLVRGLSA
jgi:type I restriction enzyme, S subunit